jgi:polyisoprenyl-phosphate glycosyltransferase
VPKLSIIIHCYYNEENIPVTTKELLENEKNFPSDVNFEYVLVDDGSKDNTLSELKKFKEAHPDKVKVVKLAGNVGSYNAIVAGMKYATGDCNVIIAADLQDPPELMAKFYTYWEQGIKFVVGNRSDRQESFLQKRFSNLYHGLMRKYALPNIPYGGFDYVLFDKKLREIAVDINEKNTNSIYLLAWMNFEMVCIPYVRRKREIGTSRWTLTKKIKLFIDSFVSFSFFPIRVITTMGLLLGLGGLLYALIVIYNSLTGSIPVQGWTSTMLVVLFIGSFQMIAMGILGEYVWRTLDAARNRPIYIVDEVWE